VYFSSFAEPGALSLDLPLVKVTTTRGVVYLNSLKEAYAEEGGWFVRNYSGRLIRPEPADWFPLRRLASW